MSIGEHRCCNGRWALGFLFLLFKNISLDNFLCYWILFIGNSKCRQALTFTIKWNRYWQVFLTCDDVKNRPKTTFFVGNAGAQWLCLNTGSLTLHLRFSHVSKGLTWQTRALSQFFLCQTHHSPLTLRKVQRKVRWSIAIRCSVH